MALSRWLLFVLNSCAGRPKGPGNRRQHQSQLEWIGLDMQLNGVIQGQEVQLVYRAVHPCHRLESSVVGELLQPFPLPVAHCGLFEKKRGSGIGTRFILKTGSFARFSSDQDVSIEIVLP